MFTTISDDVQRNKLEKFYKENLNCFLNLAFSNLHNAQDAEDAVQNAFLKIADKPEKFFDIPPCNRVSYVFVIVRNISIEMFNRKNKVPLEELDTECPYDENQISLEDDIIGEISQDKLKHFIKKLPALQRDVLTLRCMMGLSISDTAKSLNISQSSVKERLRLARKAIQEFIRKEDGLYE